MKKLTNILLIIACTTWILMSLALFIAGTRTFKEKERKQGTYETFILDEHRVWLVNEYHDTLTLYLNNAFCLGQERYIKIDE